MAVDDDKGASEVPLSKAPMPGTGALDVSEGFGGVPVGLRGCKELGCPCFSICELCPLVRGVADAAARGDAIR